jgi:hypothetical protein
MFKKIPYNVKVRVRGNEQDGFVAEYALDCWRFLPFMDNWRPISNYKPFRKWNLDITFPTLEEAKAAAMEKYDSWIDSYKRSEETKRASKVQRNIIWEHP